MTNAPPGDHQRGVSLPPGRPPIYGPQVNLRIVAAVTKAAEVCDLYLHRPEQSVVIGVDEKTAIAARSRKHPDQPVRPAGSPVVSDQAELFFSILTRRIDAELH